MQTQTHSSARSSKAQRVAHKAPARSKAKARKAAAARTSSVKTPPSKTAQGLENILAWYAHPNASNLKEIHNLYSKDVFFKDPLIEVYTSDELEAYYARTFQRFSGLRFVVDNKAIDANQAFITWVMTATMMGRDVSVRGVSHYKIDPSTGLCEYQRDYFDMSEEIYEQVPVLGFVVKGLKKAFN
jgi:hypothetical protein